MNSTEKQVWDLMTRDFVWGSEALSAIGLSSSSAKQGEDRYQVFEVVVAAIFARLRPDYDWSVTPNRPDGGIDFVGRSAFLKSDALGIDASIVIGGQCKKRVRPKNLVEELSGSLVRMANFLNPTFFVAAFSGAVSERNLTAAKEMLEAIIQRHCHILERRRVEGLISSNMVTADAVFEAAYSSDERAQLHEYFARLQEVVRPTLEVSSCTVLSLAGLPFEVPVTVHHGSLDHGPIQLRWQPDSEAESLIRLIVPVGRDTREGIEFSVEPGSEAAPFSTNLTLEFLSYSPGRLPLGTIKIVGADAENAATVLPTAEIGCNHTPPFFSSPYKSQLAALDHSLNRASTGRPTIVAVVGVGGVGKSRLCEEFAIRARRKGAKTLSLTHPATREQPYYLLAELFAALADVPIPGESKCQTVVRTVCGLDADLAQRAQSRIEALFDGVGGNVFGEKQHILSALALLIAHKSRQSTLVIHLQNMHWCTHEILETIETVKWQLSHGTHTMKKSLLWVLEGRIEEIGPSGKDHYSTRVFEAFLQRLDCDLIRCSSFSRNESEAFVEWMFERPTNPNASRSVATPIRKDVIRSVKQASSGTPFEVLEIIKLFIQLGVVQTNPITGLVFAVRSPDQQLPAIGSISEIIQSRWMYCSETNPELAKLVRAAALFEDRLPVRLFQQLWKALAPGITRADIDALQMFWLPDFSETTSFDTVAFRHENYFHAIRDLLVSETDEQAAIAAYEDWFLHQETLSIEVDFLAARVALRNANGQLRAEKHLLRIADAAKKSGLKALAARAQQTLLDALIWPAVQNSSDDPKVLTSAAKQESDLCEFLIEHGGRDVASKRLEAAIAVLASWIERTTGSHQAAYNVVLSWKLRLNCLLVEAVVNDGAPNKASQIAEDGDMEAMRLHPDSQNYTSTMMRVKYAYGLAFALSGKQRAARPYMAEAAALARNVLKEDDDALAVIGTYGNVEIFFDPRRATAILTECVELSEAFSRSISRSNLLLAHLSMAKIVAAGEVPHTETTRRDELLDQAELDLRRCYSSAHPLGQLDQAAASALLLGLSSVLRGRKDAATWFAEAITCASRSRQLETLWRAHANYAQALEAQGGSSRIVHESAAAALELLRTSLDTISEGDRSSRFELVLLPMAQMARICLIAGDPIGLETLERYPRLREVFGDADDQGLLEDRGGYSSREWLTVGPFDFVIF